MTQTSQRRLGLIARRQLSADDRHAASHRITQAVCRRGEFVAASRLGCYLPMRDEVDTSMLVARARCAGKRIFVPITKPGGKMLFVEWHADAVLQRNRLGVLEPVGGRECPVHHLDLVVVPVVAFDANLHRIGMGGGYYDRTFAFRRHRRRYRRPTLIGVAFDCQRQEKIQKNPWDITPDLIVSG